MTHGSVRRAGKTHRGPLDRRRHEVGPKLCASAVDSESQRYIAEETGMEQSTVSRATDRLEDLGWIRKMGAVDPLAPDPLRLLPPPRSSLEKAIGQSDPPAPPLSTAGIGSDALAHTGTLAALSSVGLPGSVVPTYSVLPEWSMQERTVGLTLRGVARRAGLHRTTVSRHLKTLASKELARQETRASGAPQWWRLPLDTALPAGGGGDTRAERRRQRHERQREAHLQSLCRTDRPLVERHPGPDGPVYIDTSTGEVRASFPRTHAHSGDTPPTTMASDLGLARDLLEALGLFAGAWVEYGVLEQAYARSNPTAFALLVETYGHRLLSAPRYTASAYISRTLVQMGRAGMSSVAEDQPPASGPTTRASLGGRSHPNRRGRPASRGRPSRMPARLRPQREDSD